MSDNWLDCFTHDWTISWSSLGVALYLARNMENGRKDFRKFLGIYCKLHEEQFGTFWECLISWMQVFFYCLDSCLLTTLGSVNGLSRFFQDISDLTQKACLTSLFHDPHIKRGGGLYSRGASCSRFLLDWQGINVSVRLTKLTCNK